MLITINPACPTTRNPAIDCFAGDAGLDMIGVFGHGKVSLWVSGQGGVPGRIGYWIIELWRNYGGIVAIV